MPSYLEIALRVATPTKLPDATLESHFIEAGRATQAESEGPQSRAACGSPDCGGCYEVAPGVRLHPPKSSLKWLAWLERWEAKGRVQ